MCLTEHTEKPLTDMIRGSVFYILECEIAVYEYRDLPAVMRDAGDFQIFGTDHEIPLSCSLSL